MKIRARQASSGSNLIKYYIALTKGCIMLNAKQMLHDWENEKEWYSKWARLNQRKTKILNKIGYDGWFWGKIKEVSQSKLKQALNQDMGNLTWHLFCPHCCCCLHKITVCFTFIWHYRQSNIIFFIQLLIKVTIIFE